MTGNQTLGISDKDIVMYAKRQNVISIIITSISSIILAASSYKIGILYPNESDKSMFTPLDRFVMKLSGTISLNPGSDSAVIAMQQPFGTGHH